MWKDAGENGISFADFAPNPHFGRFYRLPPYLAVASRTTVGRFSVSDGVCPHREAFIHSFSRVIHKKEKTEYFHLFSTALNMAWFV